MFVKHLSFAGEKPGPSTESTLPCDFPTAHVLCGNQHPAFAVQLKFTFTTRLRLHIEREGESLKHCEHVVLDGAPQGEVLQCPSPFRSAACLSHLKVVFRATSSRSLGRASGRRERMHAACNGSFANQQLQQVLVSTISTVVRDSHPIYRKPTLSQPQVLRVFSLQQFCGHVSFALCRLPADHWEQHFGGNVSFSGLRGVLLGRIRTGVG